MRTLLVTTVTALLFAGSAVACPYMKDKVTASTKAPTQTAEPQQSQRPTAGRVEQSRVTDTLIQEAVTPTRQPSIDGLN